MNEFKGRRILVTGGSSGIGRACVQHLVNLGASVGNLDLDTTRASDSIPFVEVSADVRDGAAVDQAVTQIAQSLGGIDALVNNAGVSFVGGVEDGTEDDWARVLDINVGGYVRTIRAALPYLRQSRTATIVNISSTTATSGFRLRALYSASKGAIEAMTRSIAADFVAEDITVNAVNPGTVDTPFMTELALQSDDPKATRAAFERRQPTGRMVRPEEVARAVEYCVDPVNRSLVGSTLVVDGGILASHITEA